MEGEGGGGGTRSPSRPDEGSKFFRSLGGETSEPRRVALIGNWTTDAQTVAWLYWLSNPVVEFCALPEYYAASSGNRSPTFRDNI
jgi:hypothetical protein